MKLETMCGDAAVVVIAPLDGRADVCRSAEGRLSPDERRRADRFAREPDRRRFVVTRACLRELLGERLGISPTAIRFTYGPAGKPRLADWCASADLRFNVSHCGDLAALVLAEGREVGIDIEEVRALPDADDVAALVFSEHERAEYAALPAAQKPRGFFNGWTRKEAFVKGVGDGLGYGLDRFDVSLAPTAPARLIRVGRMSGERTGWALHAFEPAPEIAGAIALGPPHHCASGGC